MKFSQKLFALRTCSRCGLLAVALAAFVSANAPAASQPLTPEYPMSAPKK